MKFGNPNVIYLFVLPLIILLFYIWAFRRRDQILHRFAEEKFIKVLAASFNMRRRKFKVALVICAFALCIFALIRPKWGFEWQEVKRKGLDIIIALDTSRSMLAEDVKPNRFERSKLAIEDLVRNLKGDRIGLIAFSGTAFLQCPLTVDYNGFMLALNNLDTGIIPRGGTSISSAIKEAIKSYEGGQKQFKALIIITDGEDHEGDALKEAQIAAKDGIKIYCIGIGTKEGELIPVRDEKGRVGFLKDREGNVVKSHLDENSLQRIALATGGTYVHATTRDFGLNLIYEEKLSKLEKRSIESKMKKHYEERFQIPLGIAFVILMLEPFIGERKREKWVR